MTILRITVLVVVLFGIPTFLTLRYKVKGILFGGLAFWIAAQVGLQILARGEPMPGVMLLTGSMLGFAYCFIVHLLAVAFRSLRSTKAAAEHNGKPNNRIEAISASAEKPHP